MASLAAEQAYLYATDPDYATKIAAIASTVTHNAAASSDLKLAGSQPISADTGAL